MTITDIVADALSAVWGIYEKAFVDFGQGIIVEGIINQSSHYDNKDLGGYESADGLTLVFKASDLPSNVRSLVGDVVYIDGTQWRLASVRQGAAAVTAEFVSPSVL